MSGATSSELPFDDTTDFEDARRGFIGRLEPCTVRSADGRVVWDLESYRFLEGPAPATANPSLWRQSQLNTIDGLFEVVPGIYQVRGFDLSNITFGEGDTGVLVIGPAHLERPGGGGARPVPGAPREPASAAPPPWPGAPTRRPSPHSCRRSCASASPGSPSRC